jgi:uncharacterized protein
MTPEFTVPINDLDAGGREFRFALSVEWMRQVFQGQVDPAGPDGVFEVRVSKSGQDVVVHGTLRAQLVAPCARCLEPASIAIDDEVSALLVPEGKLRGSEGEHDEYEFSSTEADILTYSGDTVVLDGLVRDELLLEVPMIPLCSESCPGIKAPPAQTGKGDGIDPRFAPLLKLKEKL